MDLKCPSCKREFEIGNTTVPRENIICPFCEAVLFRAGDLTFQYGKNVPDRGDGKRRISCPYCQQKYVISEIPYHGLIGCQICLNIFSVPKPFLQRRTSEFMGQRTPVLRKLDPTPDAPTLADDFTPEKKEGSSVVSITRPDSISNPMPHGNDPFRGLRIPGNEEDRTCLEKDFDNENSEPVRLAKSTAPEPVRLMKSTPPEQPAETAEQPAQPAESKEDSGSPLKKIGGNMKVFFQNNAASAGDGSGNGKKSGPGGIIITILLNILWLAFGGLFGAIGLMIDGLFFCLTIIGIPFGFQLFKIATLFLSPFGAEVMYKQDRQVGCLNTGMNIIWIIFFGLITAIANFLVGLIFCITIIGIPFGLQYFKLGKIMFAPFGIEIVRKDSLLIPACTAGVLFLIYLIVFLI